MCVGMEDLQVAIGGGLATGHLHLRSIQVTYHEPSSGAPLCFPILLELVPDDTAPGPEGERRGLGELSTVTYGLAVDWGPVAEEGGKKRLDVSVCVGRIKIVLTKVRV